MKAWILLFAAISLDVVATAALKASQGLSRFWPSVVVVASYLVSFYLFSVSLETLPLNLAYPIWAGVGTVATAIVGVLLWKEGMDYRHILAIGLIIIGVVILKVIAPPTE
ncbi:MAG: multidrug efflux SMR transporter [Chloroflexota bacterium]